MGTLSAFNLDHEAVPKYVLTLSAKDQGQPSLETHCNLTVVVLDVNDNSPKFLYNQYSVPNLQTILGNSSSDHVAVSFTQGKYAVTIPEDLLPESSIMQVQAQDPDQGVNGQITYSIAQESTWLFWVDNLTGIVTTAG